MCCYYGVLNLLVQLRYTTPRREWLTLAVVVFVLQKAMCNHIITRIREVMPGTEKKIKNAALGPGRVDAVLLGRKEGLRLGDGYPLPTGAYYLRDSAAY